jgi:hypothetical protein
MGFSLHLSESAVTSCFYVVFSAKKFNQGKFTKEVVVTRVLEEAGGSKLDA